MDDLAQHIAGSALKAQARKLAAKSPLAEYRARRARELVAAQRMAKAIRRFMEMSDPDDVAADGTTVLMVHAKALEEALAAWDKA
jgi:hypothetical protein